MATHRYVKQGVTLRLYINGVLQASPSTALPTILNDANEVTFGAGSNGNPLIGDYFNGILDEVRFYNRALNAAEILTDRNTPISDY